MPSKPVTNNDRQVPPAPGLLAQSLRDPVPEQENGRSSRKKGRKSTPKETNLIETEEPPVNDLTAPPSPPQRARRFRGARYAEEPEAKGNHNKSPILNGLGSLDSETDNDTSYRTNQWTRSIPLGVSPPVDALSRPTSISESPPVALPAADRGGYTIASPPISPPQRKARPLSYGGHSSGSRQPSSEKNHRYPASHAQFVQPPLPHLPQAHFYGAPDIDLGLGAWPQAQSKDDTVHFMSFDNLATTGPHDQRGSTQCLLVGSSGRLDVIGFDGEKLKPLGFLPHLQGDVISAKLLPSEAIPDSLTGVCPLVVVVSHGLKLDTVELQSPASGGGSDDSDAVVGKRHPEDPNQTSLKNFQTRVDVFSLSTQERVATLFESEIVQSTPSVPGFRGLPSLPPPPLGDLSVSAKGRYVLLTSGASGEVYIFSPSISGFRCIAKLWTTLQARDVRKYSSSSSSADSEASPADPYGGRSHRPLPLLTSSDRWLAFVPPAAPSRPSNHGTVFSGVVHGRVPGLDSLTAPPKPPPTCAIDSPDAESILNRMARGVAKEVVKGAKWLGEQGMQTWNNYWNRDASPPQASTFNNRFNQPLETVYPPNVFPPTHAPEARTPTDEPAVVSVIDLTQLEQQIERKTGASIAAIATFQPPGGCSFLSFSPTGLSLLTATKKGDVQYIWDLMQLAYTRTVGLVSSNPASVDGDPTLVSPRIRQIAKYARLSSSSILDLVWTDLIGDRFAMLTRNGTIHVFDVPQSAFQWPPPRRIARAPPQSPGLSPSRASEPDTTSSMLASAMKFAGKTQPILANLRGRAPSMGTTFSGMGGSGMGFASATGVRSGKAVAAGLSKSVGAASDTVNNLRHAGENRVHLNGLAKDPQPGRLVWVHQRGRISIAAVDEVAVRIYRIKRRIMGSKQPGRIKVSVIDARRAMECPLPSMDQLAKVGEKDVGFWKFGSASRRNIPSTHTKHPLSHAELETNAPYQPFHSDRRVNLFVYKVDGTGGLDLLEESMTSSPSQLLSMAAQPASAMSPSQWIFGDEIPTTQLNLRASADDDDPASEPVLENETFGLGRNSTIIRQAPGGQNVNDAGHAIEEIVITTRRRKNKGAHNDGVFSGGVDSGSGNHGDSFDEDGFFEDDCEVLDWAGDRV